MVAAKLMVMPIIMAFFLMPITAAVQESGGSYVGYANDANIISYPFHIKAPPDTSFEFQVAVKNTGNTVIGGLSIETGSDWLLPGAGNFSMEPLETRFVPIKLSIPANAGQGDYLLNISLGSHSAGKDTVSFMVAVSGAGESLSMSRIDKEFVGLAIENFKKRIAAFSEKGYPVKTSEDFAIKAEGAFRSGAIMESIAYLDSGEEALDESAKKAAAIKLFSTLYILVMMILGPIALACYIYRRHVK